jgi:predicted acyltransferase
MAASRIRSIDIFRGLTMLVMIFVNEVAGVKGLPWWTYHMPPGVNGMTYVDVVFPAFLFIVGLSIPLAIERRLELGDSMPRLWGHILFRSLGLVVIGIVLANADVAATGMPPGVWPLLALLGAILFWLVYPAASRYQVLKYAGLVLLIVMLAVFRRKTPTGEAWLDFGYWEILGLIGRAYLAACILYVPFRKKLWAPAAWLVILTAWNIGSRLGMPNPARLFPHWVWPFDSGELPSIVMAGIVASLIFRHKATWAIGYAAILLTAGAAFSFLGISKNAATPTWCLYCSGIGVLLFLIIHWLADVRGWYAWAAFVRPAGANTLLTYLLPDLYYFATLAIGFIPPFRTGWSGAVRALIFTGCILGVSFLLTGKRVRMQL